MYSMWLDSYNDVVDYLDDNSKGRRKCYPFQFNLNGKGVTSKFKIEELDSLTSIFENEQHLLHELLKYSDTYIKGTPKNNIIITYHKNNKTTNIPIIYNDRLISSKSAEIRRKKQDKTNKEILLGNDILLQDFIGFIKHLALNPLSRKYILDPDSLGEDIPYRIKKDLKKLVKDDVKKYQTTINGIPQYKIVDTGIKTLLNSYVQNYSYLKHLNENNLPSLEVENEFDDICKKINIYFRKDYRNLRTMIAFENKYLEALEMSIKNDPSIENKIITLPLIQEVKIQKDVRNDIVDRRMLDEYYALIENPQEVKPSFIEHQRIDELYKSGGVEAVMESLSADEIYGKYSKDLEKIGLLSNKKKH